MRAAAKAAWALAAACLILTPVAAAAQTKNPRGGGEQEDRVVQVDDDDAKMNAAIAEARRTLPQFWGLYQAADPSRSIFSVKVGMDTRSGLQEHLWVQLVSRDAAGIRGQVANIPEDVPGLRLGDVVTVDPQRISDWAYVKGGKRYGAYTTRVLLPLIPAEEAAPIRAQLSPTPLEPK